VAQLRDLGEHRLKDLTRPEHIFQLISPDLHSDFLPIRTIDYHPNNLPPQLTALIGREEKVEEIRNKLRQNDVRLVTLTGPGGVGKTRLCLQVGTETVADYDDGVWFASLEEATDEETVVVALATALGIREVVGYSLLDALVEYLRAKHLLLMLDNFEQVAHAAPLLSKLLRAAPRVVALVTSRTRLGLQGERELIVPPLSVPTRDTQMSVAELLQCSAISLFVERAGAAASGFSLTEANAPAVTEVCRGLDALPLAIELAAARVKLLPPDTLLARMEGRLGLLTGGRGDRPTRHQTLRATISWSYDLLAPDEKMLFARLAVFAAGFTLDAAEAVCNPDGDLDILFGLEALVDHSLIRQLVDDPSELRFSMLSTIREYALEQLTAIPGDATFGRHLSWCVNLMEQARLALLGPQQQEWLNRLEKDHDNFRAALFWTDSVGRDVDHLRLAAAMFRFWEMRGYLTEGRRWLSAALTAGDAMPTDIRANALYGLAGLMVYQGDQDNAVAVYRLSLELRRELGEPRGIAESLAGLASAKLRQADYEGSIQLFEESRAVFREVADTWGAAGAINGLATAAHEQQDYERAQSLYEEGLTLFQTLGDQRNIAVSFNNLATVAHDRKDYVRAIALYDQSLAITRALDDKRTSAMALNNQGIVAHDQGDYLQATALYKESLAIFQNLGDRRGIAYLLLGLGIIADDQGDHQRAVAYHNESLALFQATGDRRGIASALTALAISAHHLDELDRAGRLCVQALTYRQETGDQEGIVECLDGLASVALSRGDGESAARLFSVGSELHNSGGMSLSPVGQAEYERKLVAVRKALDEPTFRRAWDAGQLQALDEAAAYVLNASV
jgi:predicted ATPase